MNIWALLNTTGTVYRRTGLVLDPVRLSEMTDAHRTPAEPYCVEVEIDHTGLPGARGTVTVTGTVDGTPSIAQALDFTSTVPAGGTGRLATTARFDAGTAVAFSHASWDEEETVATARAVARDGTALKLMFQEACDIPIRIDRLGQRGPQAHLSLRREGDRLDADAILFMPKGMELQWSPREGDEVVDDTTSIRWRVNAVPTAGDAFGEHHYEIPLVLKT